MRLFVGIKASPEIEKKVFNWQIENKDLPVRFIKPENLHITLVPPWYAESPKSAIRKLNKINFNKFKIVFERITINFRSHVIWIEPDYQPEEMQLLHHELSELFPRLQEKRKFKTHITIARFKENSILKVFNARNINWKFEVKNVTLFVSVSSLKSVIYKEVSSVKV